jgi:ribonuclease T2
MNPFFRCAAIGALSLAAQAADFSYYVLGLAYAPETCRHGATNDRRVCGPGGPGFMTGGLTAHTDNGQALASCPPGRPLPPDLVRSMLSYIPSEALIQQVWAKQGACTGLSPSDYFAAMRQLRDSVAIPQQLQFVSRTLGFMPAQLEDEFVRANPGLPRDGVRTACYADGGLQEMRICFDKKLAARSCGALPGCTRGAVRASPMLKK